MDIVKSIITFLLFIPYVLLIGSTTFRVKFTDKTEVYYKGWLFDFDW